MTDQIRTESCIYHILTFAYTQKNLINIFTFDIPKNDKNLFNEAF